LNGVRRRVAAIQNATESERRRRYTEFGISRFAGRLESELALYDRFTTDDELRRRREELALEIRQLLEEVDEKNLKSREERALNRLSGMAAPLLPQLGVERPSDAIALSLSELTLKIRRLDREDFLWEVGSGSNWLGYHMAIAMSLQEYFLDLKDSPVPSFLVLDQPSQVFFPKKLAGKSTESDPDPKLADDDINRVRGLFEVVAHVVNAQKERLQVIVLDHAASEIWGDIQGVHPVEEWRGGAKLIPAAWLAKPSE
jgi:hypothetical protein